MVLYIAGTHSESAKCSGNAQCTSANYTSASSNNVNAPTKALQAYYFHP